MSIEKTGRVSRAGRPSPADLLEMEPLLVAYCVLAAVTPATPEALHESSERAITSSRYLRALREEAEEMGYKSTHLQLDAEGLHFLACVDTVCGEGSIALTLKKGDVVRVH